MKRARTVHYPQPIPQSALTSHPSSSSGRSDFVTPTSDPELFDTAMSTSFVGLAVESPGDLPASCSFKPEGMLGHLQSIEPLYQVDVTQPFGPNTKCAKTFVERCLMGENGTTYKYLGLRMFSTDWGVEGKGIKVLNEFMEDRLRFHLESLNEKRSYSYSGRCKFDVALVNKMKSYSPADKGNKLKLEPTFSKSHASVSWHADSSLEHYSSIGVYHAIVDSSSNVLVDDSSAGHRDSDKWRVGLRVMPDAEGPTANTRGSSGGATSSLALAASSADVAIALPLPNNSLYFLMDDFNHHHQHCVLCPAASPKPTVRYSSTHRLIRAGNHVGDILGRAEGAVKNMVKKGARVWRNELEVWVEIENEWLRQVRVRLRGSEGKRAQSIECTRAN